jgi:hypothetical protein
MCDVGVWLSGSERGQAALTEASGDSGRSGAGACFAQHSLRLLLQPTQVPTGFQGCPFTPADACGSAPSDMGATDHSSVVRVLQRLGVTTVHPSQTASDAHSSTSTHKENGGKSASSVVPDSVKTHVLGPVSLRVCPAVFASLCRRRWLSDALHQERRDGRRNKVGSSEVGCEQEREQEQEQEQEQEWVLAELERCLEACGASMDALVDPSATSPWHAGLYRGACHWRVPPPKGLTAGVYQVNNHPPTPF